MALDQAKVLNFIEISGAIFDKAAKAVEANDETRRRYEALIPSAVEALASNGHILPTETKEAAAQLADPARALEILVAAAKQKPQQSLGTPTGEKAASSNYNSLKDPYVGRRSRPGERESYKVLKRGLGIQ